MEALAPISAMEDRKKHYEKIKKGLENIGPLRMLGVKIAELEPGRAVLTLDVHSDLVHDFGVHGGILATLADTAGAVAVITELPLHARITTVEMKINYLSPHHEGLLRAEARVLRRGKRLAVGEAEIRNQKNELIAKSLITFSIAPAGEQVSLM